MSKIKISLICAVLSWVAACGGPSSTNSNEPVSNTRDQSKRVAETVASHTIKETPQIETGNDAAPVPPASGTKRKWSRSGRPIDTSGFDTAVANAERELKSGSDDAAVKKKLGDAYFARGVALVGAQQYAAAMGDFRKALKFDPSNEEAQKQLTMIASIYNSINIEAPAEGEEPAPLEFGDQKD